MHRSATANRGTDRPRTPCSASRNWTSSRDKRCDRCRPRSAPEARSMLSRSRSPTMMPSTGPHHQRTRTGPWRTRGEDAGWSPHSRRKCPKRTSRKPGCKHRRPWSHHHHRRHSSPVRRKRGPGGLIGLPTTIPSDHFRMASRTRGHRLTPTGPHLDGGCATVAAVVRYGTLPHSGSRSCSMSATTGLVPFGMATTATSANACCAIP